MIRAALIFAFVGGVVGVSAQVQQPTFEAVSVKRNLSNPAIGPNDANTLVWLAQGQRFRMVAGTVVALTRHAYSTATGEVRGAPTWATSERYDVNAVVGAPTTIAQRRDMVRELLAQRFNLRIHSEIVQRPIYRLVRLREGGTLGPAIRAIDQDCRASRSATSAAARRGESLPFTPGTAPMCSAVVMPGKIQAGGIPLSQLARFLARNVGRPVVDATDLSGDFEFTLVWNALPPNLPSDQPALLDAVQQQLGLRLLSSTTALDVLVIDSVEQPTPD